MQEDIRAIPVLIGQLFQTVRSLSKIFPGRPFTPDGHLVGSIGEVVAADTYGLVLEKCSNEGFDAKTKDGRTVEIKLTGGKSVAVSSDAAFPEILVVLKLDRKTGFSEVYNGPFPVELWRAKKASKRRTKSIRLKELEQVNPALLAQDHALKDLNACFDTAGLP